jgi:hypothetical protein
MSLNVTTAFVNQFSANVQMLAQQGMSRLRANVRVEEVTGEFGFFDQIGSTSMVERVSRHADTPQIDSNHTRRRVPQRTFDWADLIDKPDKVKTLIDPNSAYAQAAAMAVGRQIDDLLIEAAFATAYTGKSGSTSTSFATASIVTTNYVGGTTDTGSGSATGLTIDKIAKAKAILDANEVEEEDRFFVLSSAEVRTLMGTTQITSVDYNTVKALASGSIDSFLGFKFIRSERIPNASSIRDCIAFQKKGLLLAVGMEPNIRIDERADKNYSTQVFASFCMGATRMEEERVVKVRCASA